MPIEERRRRIVASDATVGSRSMPGGVRRVFPVDYCHRTMTARHWGMQQLPPMTGALRQQRLPRIVGWPTVGASTTGSQQGKAHCSLPNVRMGVGVG